MGTATPEEPSTVYRYVKRLRSTMAEEELVAKKARIEPLRAEVKQLETDFPELLTAPRPKPSRPRRPRRPLPKLLLAAVGAGVLAVALVGGVVSGVISIGGPASAPTPMQPRYSTVEFLPRMATRPVTQQGETFYTRDLDFNYTGGTVILSGEPPAVGEFWVDDAISITVRHPDGTTATWRQDFNAGCFANRPLPPQDVTHLFQPGRNVVSITLFDVCGANVGTSGPITLATPLR